MSHNRLFTQLIITKTKLGSCNKYIIEFSSSFLINNFFGSHLKIKDDKFLSILV